ncbi:MAG: 1,3-beta-galactosyl-N-acetylhexosamine phosphorylase [Lachnotalea sp.]
MSKLNSKSTGYFTLPGESGYEELTLKMAEKWGADVIRDSDGTILSDEILNAGYGIYSTICIIRDHNEWAKQNMDKLQQSFLMTNPKVAENTKLTFHLMEDFFEEQFMLNSSKDSLKYWQVFDRTVNEEVSRDKWSFNEADGCVQVEGIIPWHKYTVSFLVYRIWEEISMYNHTTNNWEKEHLMQIDPRHVATQEYMLEWMQDWCETHPDTTVVRFTSMFYNFAWIWGSNENNRHLFSDWGSYDFTVSPLALDEFANQYGYALTAEDFINKGKLNVTHMPADKHKLDWMEFINDFVITFGKKLVDMVHNYGKQAYVFYDDSWVGIEPYGKRFKEFGFDGIIKCVFSGFEARLCAGVDIPTHELRLHPYLFPVGLGGAPTFMEGGNPTLDAKKFWNSIRRALLRASVDRIGLGGYLHLVEPYPDFCDYIEKVADEFRQIKEFHKAGKPMVLNPRIAILTAWGSLRSWTLSGHFHETYMQDLIHINESLSGSPFDVEYISFEDVKNGGLDNVDVVINAGFAGSAWSGADRWNDEEVVAILTKWVHAGGVFMGINEPSAIEGYDTFFRMAHVLGVDKDNGSRVCHGKWSYDVEEIDGLITNGSTIKAKEHIYLTDGKAQVLAEENKVPTLTSYDFGKGRGIYMSSFESNLANTRMLLNTILYACKEKLEQNYITDSAMTECTYYPDSNILVIINNSDAKQYPSVNTNKGKIELEIEAYDTKFVVL